MRFRPTRFLLPLALVVLVGIAFVFIWRARSREAYGPAVALCPGPDRYGYTCEPAAYAYVNATTPVGLFADDAVAHLDLPFPFVFYGTAYDAVTVASNGNLQFTTGSPSPFPTCLAPASGLGDLVSPYWADLDLTLAGALETDVLGEAPARVFIVEWDDVPFYGGDAADTVTFEVQLFEATNDLVFLYEDPATLAGGNGGRAVVGIQSESQGLALGYSCFQPTLPTAGGLHFPHPTEPNLDAAEPAEAAGPAPAVPTAKEPVADLITRYESEGPAALARLRLSGLNERPPRALDWRAVDLTGDDSDELIAVWRGQAADPQVAQVAALAIEDGRPTPLFDRRLSTREATYSEIFIEDVADLTGDGRADVVLRDRPSGRAWVLSAGDAGVGLLDAPQLCIGSLILSDDEGDGRIEIVRDGCPTPGRVRVAWDGTAFVVVP